LKKKSKPKPAAKAKAATSQRYELTPKERAALTAYVAKTKEVALPPRSKVNGIVISPDHPEPEVGARLLAHALGTTDNDFLNGRLTELVNVCACGGKEIDERQLNAMLATVAGVRPQDEVEALLATQMAAVHAATMSFAKSLAKADNLTLRDSAERTFNKLARTFAAQMETLKRYRTGGEQKIVVKHVNVNAGGQAIVGNVSHGASADPARKETGLLTASDEQPLPGLPGLPPDAILAQGGGGDLEELRSTS
jgi:hypothetical protein